MDDWLTSRVRASPGATALVEAETGEVWSYEALDSATKAAAKRLVALGVGPGDQVGLLSKTRPQAVHVVHAAMRLGAIIVPLSPRLTGRELSAQVETVDLSVVVCDDDTEADVRRVVGDLPLASMATPSEADVVDFGRTEPVAFERNAWALDDPVAMVFTSGTTGSPKAVVLTVKNLLASAVSSAFRLGTLPDDRWLSPLALHHMGGIAPMYRSVIYGTAVVSRAEFDPGVVADDIERYDATGISLVPTMLQQMLDAREALADSLRFVLLGGAPAPVSLVERCRERGIPVHPTYGMTETASQISTATPQEAFDAPSTVGHPLLWTTVTVMEDGHEVRPGETGELVVSGPTVSPGYYGEGDPAFQSGGFRTGDVGSFDEDGRLFVLNRLTDRIITGGENVEPGEVRGILRSHPTVE
ncbi:MAG: AMP-binding protein, partial [Halobacteriota archaeon]